MRYRHPHSMLALTRATPSLPYKNSQTIFDTRTSQLEHTDLRNSFSCVIKIVQIVSTLINISISHKTSLNPICQKLGPKNRIITTNHFVRLKFIKEKKNHSKEEMNHCKTLIAKFRCTHFQHPFD